MCVGFCSWADLHITHASWGRCAKRRLECHWVPIPLRHIVCECMHACDSCGTEMQKNSFLFYDDRKDSIWLKQNQNFPDQNPFCSDKKWFQCLCVSNLQLASVCLYCRLRSSGPLILLPRRNWQRNPRERLARIACCSTVWHPKYRRAGSFYSWHEHVFVCGIYRERT